MIYNWVQYMFLYTLHTYGEVYLMNYAQEVMKMKIHLTYIYSRLFAWEVLAT